MAFIAKYNDFRVISLDYSHEDWIALQKGYSEDTNNLVCFECGNAMIPKKRYEYDTQFFAHKPLAEGQTRQCSYSEQGSPGMLHRYIQSEIYRLGKLHGFNVDIEYRLNDGKRIADVLVNDVVIEVQNISATESSLWERTDDYLSDNKQVIWFLISPDEPKRSQKAKIDRLLETLPAFEVGTGGYENIGNWRRWGVWCRGQKGEFYSLNNLLPKIVSDNASQKTEAQIPCQNTQTAYATQQNMTISESDTSMARSI